MNLSFKGLIAGIAASVAILGGAMPSMSEEVTLTAASCFPIGSPPSAPFERVVDAINERGAGIVQIDLKGGAPAIGSPFTLTQKMSLGVYDVVGCTEAYFGNVLPEAPVFRLAEYSYPELRENGGLEMLAGLLEEKGIHYVGRHHDFGPFHLWLNQEIDSPDLTGLHLRVSPVYTAFFTSLGATVQTSNIGQIYTYMENGTVQGYGWPALGWVPTWVEVTKYRVEPGFYTAPLHTMLNQAKWETLTEEQQNFITMIVMEFEANSEPTSDEFQAALAAQNAKTAELGLSAITFTGADAEAWSGAARDAGWAEVLERSPEHGPALMELFTK
ncbi:MAG: TRAP transporter substrate-binding protein DctP [Rhizobiales bacterium]|nr:TRAP transporter substrate-binding protein DctP [Hyphomicrobiales bacterium]